MSENISKLEERLEEIKEKHTTTIKLGVFTDIKVYEGTKEKGVVSP